MTEPDHATIQFLAAKGYLVSFLDNTEEEHRDFKNYNFRLIDRVFRWSDTKQGHEFWSELNRESEHFYWRTGRILLE